MLKQQGFEERFRVFNGSELPTVRFVVEIASLLAELAPRNDVIASERSERGNLTEWELRKEYEKR